MNVLVTGSSGFVGRELVPRLRSLGHRVVGVDIEPEEQSDTFLEHDLTTSFDLQERIDVCLHLAAAVGGILFNVERGDLVAINDRINRTVADACLASGCSRFVFFSTINVFETSQGFTHEALAVHDQESPYAISKARGERFFEGSFPTLTVVRPTNLFGKKQRRRHPRRGDSHVIPELLQKIEDGRKVEVFGDGSQIRNFVHVSDVCRFVAANLELSGHNYFNLRSDIRLRIRDLVDELLRFTGSTTPVSYSEEYMSYERFQVVNFPLDVPQACGWEPRIQSIAEGLRL